MLVSIIPPRTDILWAGRGSSQYHLVLAYEMLHSAFAANYYRSLSERGEFVFLDNSAHELGTGMNAQSLLSAARACGAREMILPDRLFFGDDTLWLSREASRRIRDDRPDMKLMGVPQGRTFSEWTECLDGLLDLKIDTVGISKDYEAWPGGLSALIQRVRIRNPHQPIHLLGWGRDARQLYEIARYPEFSNIRGVDSTKPLVYAQHGIRLKMPPDNMYEGIPQDEIRQPEYPRRKTSYFDADFSPVPIDLIQHNINVFRRIAHAPLIEWNDVWGR